MGTVSTCVANHECELLWVYRGDPGACENVIVQVIEVVGEDETVLAEDTTANDGRDLKVVPGDAEANEFTIRLTCDSDDSLTDELEFSVSYTPASPTTAHPA